MPLAIEIACLSRFFMKQHATEDRLKIHVARLKTKIVARLTKNTSLLIFIGENFL